jgi:hypothetical protein
MSKLKKNVYGVLELNSSGREILRAIRWMDRWDRLKGWLKCKWTGK